MITKFLCMSQVSVSAMLRHLEDGWRVVWKWTPSSSTVTTATLPRLAVTASNIIASQRSLEARPSLEKSGGTLTISEGVCNISNAMGIPKGGGTFTGANQGPGSGHTAVTFTGLVRYTDYTVRSSLSSLSCFVLKKANNSFFTCRLSVARRETWQVGGHWLW